MNDNNGNTVIHITAESMKLALAQRMNSIEVVSVGSVPVIVNERIEESAAESAESTEVSTEKHAVVKKTSDVVVEQPTEGEVVAVMPAEELSEVTDVTE
jgi:hypothetical protein